MLATQDSLAAQTHRSPATCPRLETEPDQHTKTGQQQQNTRHVIHRAATKAQQSSPRACTCLHEMHLAHAAMPCLFACVPVVRSIVFLVDVV